MLYHMLYLLDSQYIYMHIFALTLIYQYFCESSISSEDMKNIERVRENNCHRFADMLKNYTLTAIKYEM